MTREIYWNITTPEVVLMYLSFLVALAIFGWGTWKRVRYWRAGRAPEEPWSDWGTRTRILLRETFLQTGVLREWYPGLFHALIFYSFLWLVITTATVFVHADFGIHIFQGWLYLILSLGADLGGVLLMVGIAMAAWRRYVTRPESLDRRGADSFVLVFLLAVVLTGYLVEGLRIAQTGEEYAAFSPVGWAVSLPLAGLGEGGIRGLHKVSWWIHMVGAMGFIAVIPFTKFFHLVSLPTNVFFSDLQPRRPMRRVDLEALMEDEDFDEENFSVGIGTARDFQLTDRMGHDGCIECGRCEEECCAARAGDPFSPKRFIQMLRDYGHEMLAAEDARARKAAEQAEEPDESQDEEAEEPKPIVDDVLDENFVWYCRTCRACVEVCPAKIDHVTEFVEVRRNEILMMGRLPEEAQHPLVQLENNGNAFGNQMDRVEWMEKAGFPVVGPDEEVEVLYYVGCLTSFDNTKQQIAENLARIFKRAGIEFGVLGDEEMCCGNPARALGNEMVFQMTAKMQLESIQSRKFKVLLTSCPHCYHVLSNEYRSFGADLPVMHHTEYLLQLLREGRIEVSESLGRRLTWHDPCYLGRYQDIYEPPRELLEALPGAEVVEMKDHHEKSLCCGGGGGHFWMDFFDPERNERINNLRMQQAEDRSADTVAVGCPYCMQMLTDSLALLDLDEKMKVQDVATLVAESMGAQEDESEETADS